MARSNRSLEAAQAPTVNQVLAAERIRIGAIIESPEGLRNPKMAIQLALRTSLDVESSRGLLAQAPADNPFIAAMSRETMDLNALSGDGEISSLGADPKAARAAELKRNLKGLKDTL
jgi:hypothetical protein